jgi:hypothetical protein
MNKVIATDARRLLQPFPFLAASFYKSQTTVRKPETVVTQQDVNRFGSRFTGLDFSPKALRQSIRSHTPLALVLTRSLESVLLIPPPSKRGLQGFFYGKAASQ